MSYLTEQKLPIYLNILSDDWIHDKSIPNSNTRSRPDYRSEHLKMIVEFDGYHHYNNAKRIKADYNNDKIYSELGYVVVRIPYFVQMDSLVFRALFKTELNIAENYPHGFIDDKALLPCDFCELGILRFQCDLERFGCIKKDILQSISDKLEKIKDIDLVMPKSMQGMINGV